MMTFLVHLSTLSFIFLFLYINCCDSLCDTCYVTRLQAFDNILIEDNQIWTRNVTNNGVCFRLCYADLRCVTFQHNKNTGTCRGMAASFTSPSTAETSSEPGVHLYVPCTAANRYGASCTANSDCHVTNTECTGGICKCQPGLLLSPISYLCVEPYIGCYEDNAARMLPYGDFSDVNMTIDVCAAYCITNGYVYTATQFASHCFCGDTVGEEYEKRDDSECNMACSGNPSQICGGNWRNSVYLNELN